MPPKPYKRIHSHDASRILWHAVHFEDLDYDKAKAALDASADVNAAIEWADCTPLISASYGSNARLIRLLLERGADVNAKGARGGTALMQAASFGSARIVDLLIRHGADIEAQDNDGLTALHYAANDAPKAISALLNAGASIEAKDNEGKTPLMHAAHWSRPRAVRTLVDAGADVNARSNNGYSVLRWSRQPPPYITGMSEQQWVEANRREAEELHTSLNRSGTIVDRLLRLCEVVFGTPVHEFVALERLLIASGAKE